MVWQNDQNDEIVILNESDLPMKMIPLYPKWDSLQEDILAQDWTIVDPDDIKEFYLSANQLKNLGVSQTEIDKLKNTLPMSGRLIDLVTDKGQFKDLSLLQYVKPIDILSNIKTPEYTFTKL